MYTVCMRTMIYLEMAFDTLMSIKAYISIDAENNMGF